jgi:hypothetical protein
MGRTKGVKNKKPQHRWTDEEKEYLASIVKGKTYKELLVLMNERFDYEFSSQQIESALRRYNLKTGNTGQFEKYQEPWNKGLKGYIGANKTSFKKGTIPPNYKPAGTERFAKDGYIEVKVKDPNVWELKHRYIYKKHYGDIPKGHNVIFADTDKTNFNIDNLILVSKAEMLILNKNKLIFEDKDFTKVGVNIAKLINKTKTKQ